MIQQLDRYHTPPSWSPGAPLLVRSLWFGLGSPLLAARWLPGSAWRLQVGHHCWLAEDAWIDNLAPITLGDRVCLSQGTYLCTGNHNFRSPGFDLRLGPISIGSDAWIAARAVLALGAVVSGIVPPGAIVRGNPAVVVGER